MFYQFNLELLPNIFEELSNSINFEPITKGRIGANCFYSTDSLIPLVRTTTIYSNPIQKFTQPYNLISNQIKLQAKQIYNIDVGELNNGLVEMYTHEYKTMGFHSDQALDLEPNSWICIYSIYSNPELTSSTRKLVTQSKLTGNINEYELTHNSIIMFDTNTNGEHIHKIVLTNPNAKPNPNPNVWLGITLRTSKTFIKFDNLKPYFADTMEEFVLATDQEKKEFYTLRSQENKSIGFTYPYINYTISPSDLINPHFI